MTAIPLKNIEGCLVAKRYYKHELPCACEICLVVMGETNILEKQGEVKITLNREKLARHLFYRKYRGLTWEQMPNMHDGFYKEADEIRNALPELVEVQK